MDLQEENRGIKYYIQVTVGVRRDTPEGEIRQEASFSSNPAICIQGTDLDQDIHSAFQELFKKFEEYTSEHSGWILEEVRSIHIHSVVYTPTSGSSYIPLPPKLQNTKACINIQNNDEKCFLYSVLAGLYPTTDVKHVYRVSN